MRCFLFTGTVPVRIVRCSLFTGTVPVNNLFLNGTQKLDKYIVLEWYRFYWGIWMLLAQIFPCLFTKFEPDDHNSCFIIRQDVNLTIVCFLLLGNSTDKQIQFWEIWSTLSRLKCIYLWYKEIYYKCLHNSLENYSVFQPKTQSQKLSRLKPL